MLPLHVHLPITTPGLASRHLLTLQILMLNICYMYKRRLKSTLPGHRLCTDLTSSVWQPAARGHRAYTDLSAARVRGPALCTVCSLVNWEMAGSENDTPGDSNRQPLAGEEVENLLRDLLAASKRNNEDISEQKRQNASLMKKIDSLQQGGLTEEGKKARIAPGKLRSCVLKRLDMQPLLVGDKFCGLRGIWLVLQHPACFFLQMAECALATPVNAS